MSRSFVRRLALSIVTTALVFGAVEAGLRLALPVVRTATLPNEEIDAHVSTAPFRYDPDLYWYWADTTGPGSAVNAYGFRRTRPMTVEKPPGVTRVITFGDSQTFGAGVQPPEAYSGVAERALGEGWEVLNAGISGYRTLNVYRLLRLRMAAYQPDAVVIDCMPFDSRRDDGPLVGRPDGESTADRARRLLWESRIYYLLRLGLEKADPHRGRWLDEPLPGQQSAERDLGNHDLIAAWGREQGIEVIWMQYPIMEDPTRFGCMGRDFELPPGHHVVPACDALQADGRAPTELFQDRNHLTPAGNEVVGAALAETLRRWRAGEAPPAPPDVPEPPRAPPAR